MLEATLAAGRKGFPAALAKADLPGESFNRLGSAFDDFSRAVGEFTLETFDDEIDVATDLLRLFGDSLRDASNKTENALSNIALTAAQVTQAITGLSPDEIARRGGIANITAANIRLSEEEKQARRASGDPTTLPGLPATGGPSRLKQTFDAAKLDFAAFLGESIRELVIDSAEQLGDLGRSAASKANDLAIEGVNAIGAITGLRMFVEGDDLIPRLGNVTRRSPDEPLTRNNDAMEQNTQAMQELTQQIIAAPGRESGPTKGPF